MQVKMKSIGEERPVGTGRFLVGDSESKNLVTKLKENKPTEQHVIVFQDYVTNEVFIFFDPYEDREPRVHLELDGDQDGYLADAITFMQEAESVAFHNGFGYDQPAFEKCFGDMAKYDCFSARPEGSKLYDIFPFKYMDTYVLSTLLNPDRRPPKKAYLIGKGNVGAHSIEAHGIKMGRYKPENEDWTVLTDHMIHRCVEDVGIGADLLRDLMLNEWATYNYRKSPTSHMDIRDAYRMEARIGYEMCKQADRGFRLDMQWCMQTWNELNSKIDEVEEGFRPHMPPRIMKSSTSVDKWSKCIANMQAYLSAMPEEDHALVYPVVNKLAVLGASALYELFPRAGKASTQWKLTTAKGEYTAALRKVYPEMVGTKQDTSNPLVDGAFSPVSFEEIPLGNRDEVKQVLYRYGWLGVDYNDAEEEYFEEFGEHKYPWSGKINEKSITYWKERMQPPEWCLDIAKWYILCSRRNQILNPKDVQYMREHSVAPAKGVRGLVGQAYCKEYEMTSVEFFLLYGEFPTDMDEDWRVPAVAIPIGTNTFRMRHKVVVNIPSRGLYPLRRAFIAGKGKKILGCDGSGLELRMLSHFMKDSEYEDVILNGDIHSYNQDKAGLPTRDNAKTFIYALLYGSGVANLAKVCNMSQAQMQMCMDKFKRDLPLLSALIQQAEAAAEKNGYLWTVDGRRAGIRKKMGKLLVHTVLNVLLQTTGSLCMKWGLYLALSKMQDTELLANVHDECQKEVNEEDVKEYTYEVTGFNSEKEAWKAEEKRVHQDALGYWSAPSKLGWDSDRNVLTCERQFHPDGDALCKSFAEAGTLLGIRTPLAGEYKIGDSWHDTH